MVLPLILRTTSTLALVVGGGSVGQRKIRTLLRAGMAVRVVSPGEIPSEFVDLPSLTWLRVPYQREHLEDVQLVVAAAPPNVNRNVVADAQKCGIWVNSADDPTTGNVFFPASVQRGDLLISVSTGGAAPSLARRIRERLEQQFDDSIGEWIAILESFRPEILHCIADESKRRALFDHLSEWAWLDRFRIQGEAPVREAIRTEIDRVVASGRRPV